MADVSVLTSEMDISKLKVPDLKRELKSRHLNTSGNKNELIERLQAAIKATEKITNESVDELDEDLLNEDDEDVHLETTESVISDIDSTLNDPIPAPAKGQKRKAEENGTKQDTVTPPVAKKLVLNRQTPLIENTRVSTESKEDTKSNGSTEEKRIIKLSGISAKERLEMRAKKFDTSLSNEAKKVARAERFGAANTANSVHTKVNTSIDVLKQRAERFGGSVSKVMTSMDNQQKLEKRKERFGIVSAEDKAKQRLERFKLPEK